MDSSQQLKSLKRGLRVLILLSQHRSMTVSDAARRLGLPRTTAERILLTLEAEGFIARDADSRAFGLAPRVLALAGGFSTEDRLVQVATPLLFRTTREIGWPLAVAVAAGERMSVRATSDPATSLGLHKRHVGSEIAIAGSSSGVVHLAFLEQAEREALVALLARSDDPHQSLARNPQALEAHLEAARRDGFSIGPDLGPERALSVPLLHQGRIHGVLLMMYIARAAPESALRRKFLPRLQALAGEIEAGLSA